MTLSDFLKILKLIPVENLKPLRVRVFGKVGNDCADECTTNCQSNLLPIFKFTDFFCHIGDFLDIGLLSLERALQFADPVVNAI